MVDSDNVEAFARRGNAFGKKLNGINYNFRNVGAYEIAPPPEVVWADDEDDDDFGENIMSLDFEDEDYQGGIDGNPVTPWYVDGGIIIRF